MEQRRLRLGDILDDYCPRERRVTNHAVVAMVDEDVKQTRCTTCDTEHVYKAGKPPRRQKGETTTKLYRQVLAGITDPEHAASAAAEDEMIDEPEAAVPAEAVAGAIEDEPVREEEPEPDDDAAQPLVDDGPVHRPLIRAQLPRVEGVKIERQAPDFTIRQNAGRNANFRGHGSNNGHRFSRGPQQRNGGRGGANQGFGRGPGGGNQPRHGGGGPRKRGR